ncbi:MAG: DUF373 family protein [Candidatus Aenigmatarchaeota archaeon]
MSEKLLVLCVDRDDDVGRKTDMEGPVVGREKNLELAESLALSDPEDSDPNAIFESIKIYDSKENAEIATITGDSHVGVESDERLAEQLEKVLEETGTDKVILVVDGTEDEQILPIVQSHADIVSIRRVIMKQSERLEGMYYQINEFFKEIVSDPKMGKIILGIPAIFLIFYALLGTRGWRITLGVLGTYLLVKGFHLEDPIRSAYEEVQTSFTARRVTFFFYVVSLAIAAIAINNGYTAMQMEPTPDLIESSAAFLRGSIYLFFLSFLVSIVGRSVHILPDKNKILRHCTYTAFFLGFTVVASEASRVILSPEAGMGRFAASIVFGLVIVSITLTLEKTS